MNSQNTYVIPRYTAFEIIQNIAVFLLPNPENETYTFIALILNHKKYKVQFMNEYGLGISRDFLKK
jgi:hypothetical protein